MNLRFQTSSLSYLQLFFDQPIKCIHPHQVLPALETLFLPRVPGPHSLSYKHLQNDSFLSIWNMFMLGIFRIGEIYHKTCNFLCSFHDYSLYQFPFRHFFECVIVLFRPLQRLMNLYDGNGFVKRQGSVI